MTDTNKPIAILPLPAGVDVPIETHRCAEGEKCCYAEPCPLGVWLDTNDAGDDVPRFEAIFLLVFPDLTTRAVCAECADNYRAYVEVMEASPPCAEFTAAPADAPARMCEGSCPALGDRARSSRGCRLVAV